MITCYTVPEIWHIMNVSVIFHFGLFFVGHVHEYQPVFEGIVAKLTVINHLSIIFNSEQNSGKYTVRWSSKKINLKYF